MVNNPAIVVVAYNRKYALKRLLLSIANATIPQDTTLIISIDGGDNEGVVKFAKDFIWKYGTKKVITHQENVGLRNHVLECGCLVNEYSSIIVLEDDLTVSPYFYVFSIKALQYYNSNKSVSGISLYSHQYNVNCKRLFEPIDDGFDVFWLQYASSWGQIWNIEMWNNFYDWYKKEPQITEQDIIPTYILKWPDTSWLKYFIKYLVESNTYFVYPRISLTTNHSEAGSNVGNKVYQYEVKLQLEKREYIFSEFIKAKAIYDVFFELSPTIIKGYNTRLKDYDFDVDLYGTKQLNKIDKKYLLTIKNCHGEYNMNFGRDLWPHDMNVILNSIGGKEITFGPKNQYLDDISEEAKKTELDYFYGDLSIEVRFILLMQKIVGALKRKLNMWRFS